MNTNRQAFLLSPSNPGSEVAGESAAALAAASMLFRSSNPTYSATLLQHARQLFTFANTYKGDYGLAIPDAARFYK